MRYTISPLLGRALAPKIISNVFAPSPVPPRFAAEFPVDMALRPAQIRASAEDTALMIPAAAMMNHRYGELGMPIAIMAGAADEIVDVDRQSQRLHREIPGSELRVIAGGGHMIHHLAPREVVELIRRVEDRSRQRTLDRRHAAA
jgi:pimeloyl-ACP methyl ester carboxylesterase